MDLPDIFEWIIIDGELYEREEEEKKYELVKYRKCPC